jgi:hypothetical protein
MVAAERALRIAAHKRESIDLVMAADVCEDRTVLGGELKYDPNIVLDGETPELLKVAGKFVRAQSGIVRVVLEHLHPLPKLFLQRLAAFIRFLKARLKDELKAISVIPPKIF